MAPILKKFRANIVSGAVVSQYFFLANPSSYAGSLDTITGITEATDAEQNEPNVKVGELLNSGQAFRVHIQYTSAFGTRTGKILVSKDKLSTALDSLLGKPYRGGTIKFARIPTKATYI